MLQKEELNIAQFASVKQLVLSKLNVRQTGPDTNAEEFKELVDAVKRDGVRVALKVRPTGVKVKVDGETTLEYEILDGQHRWMAAKKAKVDSVPIEVSNVHDDAEAIRISADCNRHRRDVSVQDWHDTIVRLLAMKNKDGTPRFPMQKDVAEFLGMSPQRVSGIMSHGALPAEVKEEVRKGNLTVSAADTIAQGVEEPEEQIEAARIVIAAGKTKKEQVEVARRIRDEKKGRKRAPSAVTPDEDDVSLEDDDEDDLILQEQREAQKEELARLAKIKPNPKAVEAALESQRSPRASIFATREELEAASASVKHFVIEAELQDGQTIGLEVPDAVLLPYLVERLRGAKKLVVGPNGATGTEAAEGETHATREDI